MSALAAAAGVSLGAAQLAALCEAVEVRVVGAPCGPYDQLVAACAVEGELIVADCGATPPSAAAVALPDDVRLWGVASGVRHQVGGVDFDCVRAGAFIGRTLVRALAAADAARVDNAGEQPARAAADVPLVSPASATLVDADAFALAALRPHEVARADAPKLPADARAAPRFARRPPSAATATGATEVAADRTYAKVRAPAARAPSTRATARASRASYYKSGRPPRSARTAALALAAPRRAVCSQLASYARAAAIGAPATDRLVALAEELGLAGAKVTGGGRGGSRRSVLGSRLGRRRPLRRARRALRRRDGQARPPSSPARRPAPTPSRGSCTPGPAYRQFLGRHLRRPAAPPVSVAPPPLEATIVNTSSRLRFAARRRWAIMCGIKMSSSRI